MVLFAQWPKLGRNDGHGPKSSTAISSSQSAVEAVVRKDDRWSNPSLGRAFLMAQNSSIARMKKLKRVKLRLVGIIFLGALGSIFMWSAGWISARVYFAEKIESSPKVIQAPPQESIFLLVNKERRLVGLDDLYLDEKLIDAARAKSCDMRDRGYYSHEDPDGNMGWHFVDEQGADWSRIGENIAKGYTDPAAVMQAWMDSPSHRKNILDPNFRYIGYASCGDYVAQFFVR